MESAEHSPKPNPHATLASLMEKDHGAFGRFIQFFLLALLIRLLVMPFFAHIDFFSEQRRIFILYENGVPYLGGRFITTLVEWLNFHLVSPLIAEKNSMFQMADFTKSTASHLQYFAFVSHHAILRTLFLLKLPYLVFDLATGVLFYHLFEDKKRALRTVAIWFFNPVTIFAFYIFSRYESIPLFFMAGALFFLKREQLLLSATALGLAIWSREIILVTVPLFALYLLRLQGEAWLRKVYSLGIIGLFALFAANLIPMVFGIEDIFQSDAPTSIAAAGQSLSLIGFDVRWYYPFVTLYALIGMWLLSEKHVNFEKLCVCLGLFYCSFFVFVIHSVHYVSWAFVLFAILGSRQRSTLVAVGWVCVTWVVFWAVNSDLGVFTQWLASPASLFMTSIPTLPSLVYELVEQNTAFSFAHTIGIFRSVHAAAWILFAIAILRTPASNPA